MRSVFLVWRLFMHARSHGEAFMALFENRMQPGGILIMDEPEAALSPQRQLSLLALLHTFVESGNTQVFIAILEAPSRTVKQMKLSA